MTLHEGIKYQCGQCHYQATLTHQRKVHERIKYPCRQCDHQTSSKGGHTKPQKAVHERVKYA